MKTNDVKVGKSMGFEIKALPKEQWKGTPIPLTTRSDSYYIVR